MQVIGVRVKKCDNPKLWYFHHIGWTFQFLAMIFDRESFARLAAHTSKKVEVVDNEGHRNLINQRDCEVGVELDSGVRVWLK